MCVHHKSSFQDQNPLFGGHEVLNTITQWCYRQLGSFDVSFVKIGEGWSSVKFSLFSLIKLPLAKSQFFGSTLPAMGALTLTTPKFCASHGLTSIEPFAMKSVNSFMVFFSCIYSYKIFQLQYCYIQLTELTLAMTSGQAVRSGRPF
jgi:hypothetical protein